VVLEAFGEPLLIDAGYYPWYFSPHDIEFTRQTRAHNAVLVNHKGQGSCNAKAAGRIVGFASSSVADIAIGDATQAYQEPSLATDTTSHHLREDYRMPFELCAANEGVRQALRTVVYLRAERAVVIIDRIATARPASVQLLFHSFAPFTLAAGGPAVARFEYPTDEERQAMQNRSGRPPQGLLAPPAALGPLELRRGAAVARLQLLGGAGEEVALSQTDAFPVPPERDADAQGQGTQWHLCADWPARPSATERLLVTVISVAVAGAEAGPLSTREDAAGRLSLGVGTSALTLEYDAGAAAARPWLRRLAVRDGAGGWLLWAPDGDDASGSASGDVQDVSRRGRL
jgi:hypothetical protein